MKEKNQLETVKVRFKKYVEPVINSYNVIKNIKSEKQHSSTIIPEQHCCHIFITTFKKGK